MFFHKTFVFLQRKTLKYLDYYAKNRVSDWRRYEC